VTIAPMVLRRKMSRFTRTTEKFVRGVPERSSSRVSMFIAPMPKRPTLPVTRPPTSIGISRPAFRPMRRL
jgi:hypothetical protein